MRARTTHSAEGLISYTPSLWDSVIIMEEYRSVIMEAVRDRSNAAELVSYKEVLYDEATEEWFAPYDPKEVECEERNCMRLARQFYWKSTENDFSPMYSFNHQHRAQQHISRHTSCTSTIRHSWMMMMIIKR